MGRWERPSKPAGMSRRTRLFSNDREVTKGKEGKGTFINVSSTMINVPLSPCFSPCVFAALSNLDQDEGVFKTSIGNTLDSKLIAVCVAD
jgi:hypothetical protein